MASPAATMYWTQRLDKAVVEELTNPRHRMILEEREFKHHHG